MMQISQTRRDFLTSTSLAAAVSVLGSRSSFADEGPLETTTVRLPFNSNICLAPQFVAEELLRADGFTDVRYVRSSGGLAEPQMAGSGEIDFGTTTAAALPFQLDAGASVTALAGVHAGCYELFAHGAIQSIPGRGDRLALSGRAEARAEGVNRIAPECRRAAASRTPASASEAVCLSCVPPF